MSSGSALAQSPVKSAPQAAKKAAGAKAQAPLPQHLAHALGTSVRTGKNGVLAGVFEAVHSNPSLRNQVFDYARTLAPGLTRDLGIAADLGVLTAGQKLLLAPNAAEVLAARTPLPSGNVSMAMSRGAGAPAVNYAPAAAGAPDLTNPVATQVEQTWHLDAMKASVAWGRNYTGAGVNVSVSDTGFDTANQALASKLLTNLGRNYVLTNKGDVYDPAEIGLLNPTDMHGTHVAGIIAAKKYNTADPTYANYFMSGVAYDANIIPLRSLTAKTGGPPAVDDASASALEYFASLPNAGVGGSMVYNASYGPDFNEQKGLTVWSVGASTTEYDAAKNALKAGKIIVAANGNDRIDNPDAGKNPSGLALMPFLEPGHANTGVYDDHGENLNFSDLNHQPGQLIAVMAIAQNKTAATYSNLCGVTASWCVAGTGGDTPYDKGIYAPFPGNTYGFSDGTSMATPSVSGAIAVLISAYPNYNAQDLARLLFSTTEDLGLPGLDAVFGYGLVRLDRATDGPTSLAAGATQTVAADTTVYWSQPLTASGGFTKDGAGILTIAGNILAPGHVDVLTGTLSVDGTLSVTGAGNSLNIAQTGTLAGIGEVRGNTLIDGTLSPGKMANIGDLVANGAVPAGTVLNGNSAGQITFNGNVMLNATATTRVDIDGVLNTPGGPGTYDRIFVTGAGHTFTAGGTLTPVLRDSVGTPSNYTPTFGSSFKFVQATEGAQTTGRFATLTQPTAGLPENGRFDLIYSPLSITLTVTPESFAAMVGDGFLPPAAQGVAGILDQNRPAPNDVMTGNVKTIFDAIYGLNSPASYTAAITQLAGNGQNVTGMSTMAGMVGFSDSISDRQSAIVTGSAAGQEGSGQSVAFAYAGRTMSAEVRQAEAAFASAIPAPSVEDTWGVWGQAFGRWSSVGDADGVAGSNTRSGGFTIGADRLLGPDLIGGIAGGFARSETSGGGARSTADSYSGAIYATWTPGRAVVDVRAAVGPSSISTTRNIILTPNAIEGKTNAFGGIVSGEFGYLFAVAPAATVKPYAGLSYQVARRDGFTETQLPFGLVFPTQTYEKLTSTLGVAYSQKIRMERYTLMPEIKVGWAHDWRDTTLVSEAALLDTAFTTNAANPGRDAALLGVKFSGWMQENFRLFTAYNGEYRSNAQSHQVSGGARYTW